jgi:hypothetical protein
VANFTEESVDENVEVTDLFEGQQEEAQDFVQEEPQSVEGEQQPAEEDEDLPSKYKGKSLKDIIRMHQEAEKLIGRQAQEVGEVRKLADDLIKRQLKPEVQEEATKEDEIDFFEDPDSYVKKAVEKHPAIAEAKAQAMALKQAKFADQLQKTYPDFQQTVNDPEFVEWVKASPVRLQLYADADSNLNFDSASELLGNWGYIKAAKSQQQQQATTEVVKQDRAKALKTAAVSTGSVGIESKKTYRREDIRNLMMRDPERYQQMQPELMAAYAEGRVI